MKSSNGSKESTGFGRGFSAVVSYTSQPVTLGLSVAGTLSKRSFATVSKPVMIFWCEVMYLVHAPNEGKIGRCVILSGNKHAVSLGSGQIDHVRLSCISVDSIHFHYAHRVVLDPEVLPREGTHIYDTKHVSLAGLNRSGQILGVIHQSRIRYRFCTSRVRHTDEALHKTTNLVVIPIRECKDQFLVVLTFVW